MIDMKAVKLINGSLHESPLRGGTIILRGVLDAATLKNLRFDDYQREALPTSSLRKIMSALEQRNPLPDIEVGMRGEKVSGRGEEWLLNDPCFVIDGQQRINACITYLAANPGAPVFLGATIHLSSTYDWERERFKILNSDRIKVSPNVLLRNMRRDSVAVNKIYELSQMTDDVCCLGGRVSWDQNMKKGKLFTALNVLRVTGRLHSHITAASSDRIDDLPKQLDVLCNKITPSQMRDNVKAYFEFLDEAWGVRMVQYRDLSRHLAGGWMVVLATFLSNHEDFWKGVKGYRLYIETDLKRKIASFPINDPGISPLTSSHGASQNVLYSLIIKHVNSGKRTKKLKPRIETQDEFPTEGGE